MKIKGNVVEFYNSIYELPAINFIKIQKMWLINAGIGSNITDFDKHFKDMIVYANAGEKNKLLNEINNTRILFNNIQTGNNPIHYLFLDLIKSLKKKAMRMLFYWSFPKMALRKSKYK